MKLLGAIVLARLGAGCSRSNNLLMGRVEASVGGHLVAVTDCYQTSVAPPRFSSSDGPAFCF